MANLGIVIKSLRENIELDKERLKKLERVYGIKNCEHQCTASNNKPHCVGSRCDQYPKID